MDLRDQLQETLGSAYTIERELGGGGMSRVFVARETTLGREVVVKVLPAEMAGAVSAERFKREITVAARLQHAHIVPLHTAGDSAGLPFYTMPLVEGESLRTRLDRGGELPILEAVKILRDVASALAYAHARGVIHRDIKPANILLTAHDALVTDFGVAKALSGSALGDAASLTSLGMALGTPAYMAPEQAAADPTTDYRADIYSLGVVAYEMLAGHGPFPGRSATQVLAAHARDAPPPLRQARPNVPVPLATLVMRCLEKRPADRPQTAAEIVQALDAMVRPRSGALPALDAPAPGPGQPVWTRPGARAAAAALVVVLGGSALAVWRGRSGAPPPSTNPSTDFSASRAAPAKSVAVLPFTDLSGAKDSDFFRVGVTEEITDALGKVPGLRVAARTSAAASADKGLDLPRIGRELGVGSILQGTIQRVGTRVRINAQLIDAATAFQRWSGRYDDELKDIFHVQDTIARAIVGSLRIELAGGNATPIVRVATENAEAHTLYLQGLYLWNRRSGKTIRQAISYFEQAIAKDPRYAQAYAGIALGYAALTNYADVGTVETIRKSEEAARRALAVDSTVVEAHAAIGFGEMSLWRNAAAERELLRAIALDSTFATAHHWRSILLGHLGRHDEAIRESRQARDLDPQSLVIAANVGSVFYRAHRFPEAERALRQVLDVDPSFQLATRRLGQVLMEQRRYADAIAALTRTLELDGERLSINVALLARAHALGGHAPEARALLQELITRSARGPVTQAGIALVYDALGERAHALQSLGRAVSEYDWQLYGNGPVFDHLRADPRANALIARTETMSEEPPARTE